MFAWESGLKTTYYLRTLAASQVQKMVDLETLKEVAMEREKEMKAKIKEDEKIFEQPKINVNENILKNPKVEMEPMMGKACNIYDEDCEACQ